LHSCSVRGRCLATGPFLLFRRVVLVTSVIGLAFLPRGSVLTMITPELLPILPP
jgi:hypothetical protein